MLNQPRQGNLESVSAGSAQSQAAEAIATTECNEVKVRWQERGYTVGSPDEDWLRAERELNGRAALSSTR